MKETVGPFGRFLRARLRPNLKWNFPTRLSLKCPELISRSLEGILSVPRVSLISSSDMIDLLGLLSFGARRSSESRDWSPKTICRRVDASRRTIEPPPPPSFSEQVTFLRNHAADVWKKSERRGFRQKDVRAVHACAYKMCLKTTHYVEALLRVSGEACHVDFSLKFLRVNF